MPITMTEAESRTQATFTALMWALSYPGRVYDFPAQGRRALTAIAETLIDLETSYYTPDPELARYIAALGGRSAAAEDAAYHFYPELCAQHMPGLEQALQGTFMEPDTAATLFIACRVGAGARLSLTGPGVPKTAALNVGGLPEGFWTLRQRTLRFPLGWDIFLVGDSAVAGLPRTTVVEVL